MAGAILAASAWGMREATTGAWLGVALGAIVGALLAGLAIASRRRALIVVDPAGLMWRTALRTRRFEAASASRIVVASVRIGGWMTGTIVVTWMVVDATDRVLLSVSPKAWDPHDLDELRRRLQIEQVELHDPIAASEARARFPGSVPSCWRTPGR